MVRLARGVWYEPFWDPGLGLATINSDYTSEQKRGTRGASDLPRTARHTSESISAPNDAFRAHPLFPQAMILLYMIDGTYIPGR